MEKKKNSQNMFDYQTYDQKKFAFMSYFTLGSNSNSSFSEKIELITLICFLFQRVNKKEEKYHTVRDMMLDLYKNNLIEGGFEQYFDAICLICDDMLFGVEEEIQNPGNYKKAGEIIDRIKTLISQWLPF